MDRPLAEIEAAVLAAVREDRLTPQLARAYRIACTEHVVDMRARGVICPVCDDRVARRLDVADETHVCVCDNGHRWTRIGGRLVEGSVTTADPPHPVGPTRPAWTEPDAAIRASVAEALHDDCEPGRGEP